ncbi:MAG TPA: enoyl-CoA hydratase/isomerase family protein [Solirubrobacterales bacterium]|jgi:enoyl-CoA hydratase
MAKAEEIAKGKIRVEQIELEEEGTRATLVTLNQPDALNPLDWDVFRGLEAALQEAEAEPAVRTVLVTGAGRAFSAGGDLKGYLELQRDRLEYPRFLTDAHRTLASIRRMKTPVVSLVNGVTVAGGLELTLFSDWAYAAESARIGDSHLTFGMPGGGGVLTLLPRSIHPAKARELVLTGRLLSAEEAREWGIVNRVLPDDELLDAGLELANSVARKSPLAIAQAKHVMNEVNGDGSSFDSGLRYEKSMTIHYCLTSDDAQEGLRAFAEKRRPKFAGR